MILRGPNGAFFELKALQYEYPKASSDNWYMNLLRVAVYARTVEGNEGKCETYLLTSEIKWLKEWLESIWQKMPDKMNFECYSGVFRFDFMGYIDKNIDLRIHFYLSGKSSQLPSQRDEEFGWVDNIEFSFSPSQIKGGIVALERTLVDFPERIS